MTPVDLVEWDAMVARSVRLPRYTKAVPAPPASGNMTYDLLRLLHIRLKEAEAEVDAAKAAGDMRAEAWWERRGEVLGGVAGWQVAEVREGRADRSPIRLHRMADQSSSAARQARKGDDLSAQMRALMGRSR